MGQGERRFISRIGVAFYWLLLAVVLAFLPILQSWEALPQGGIWAAARLCIVALVVLGLVVSYRTRLWHIAMVAGLLAVGALLFALNQGIISEPATQSDVRILQRTARLLEAPDNWDRSSTRECLNDGSKLTLYCALRRASLEEVGSFRHRRPALQIVRAEIGRLRPNADYEHRLSGFNSDPGVSFNDLQRLLASSAAQASRNAD